MKNNLTLDKKEIIKILKFINKRIHYKLKLTDIQEKFLKRYKHYSEEL